MLALAGQLAALPSLQGAEAKLLEYCPTVHAWHAPLLVAPAPYSPEPTGQALCAPHSLVSSPLLKLLSEHGSQVKSVASSPLRPARPCPAGQFRQGWHAPPAPCAARVALLENHPSWQAEQLCAVDVPSSVISSKPSAQRHTRSTVVVQSLASVVPLPHVVHVVQVACPAALAKDVSTTHAGHVFVAPPTIAPCPAWQWHTRSLLGVHADSSAAPKPHTVHAAQTATPGTAVNVLPAAHAPQVLVEPPARSP